MHYFHIEKPLQVQTLCSRVIEKLLGLLLKYWYGVAVCGDYVEFVRVESGFKTLILIILCVATGQGKSQARKKKTLTNGKY